jgi:hypothetical protein
MSLVRWFRRNNTKLMAVVVIVIMIGFVGGSYISRLGRGSPRRTVAYIGTNKVSNYDLAMAQRQLEILATLGVPLLLSPPPSQNAAGADLRAAFLGELLFSGQGRSGQAARLLRRAISINNYAVSESQLDAIYNPRFASRAYWLMLRTEAERAGVVVSRRKAAQTLGPFLSQVYGAAAYPQVMREIMNRFAAGEKEILDTFGQLMAVLEYARTATDMQAVTRSQTKHSAARQFDTVDAEYVRFDAASYSGEQPDPAERQVAEHFEKYKGVPAGTYTPENPFGFGYMLEDAVSLEYLAVKLDEVEPTVEPPSAEAVEQYYQAHRGEFVERYRSDPNDPNSPLASRVRGYAEVANTITDRLLRNAVDTKARRLLEEAEALIGPSGGYEAAAAVADKHGLTVYTGRTGLLGAEELSQDRQLAGLYLDHGGEPVELSRLVLAVEPLGSGAAALPEIDTPGLNETIGPLRDYFRRITALVRVLEVRKARPPALAESFSVAGLRLEPQQEDPVFSVRSRVVDDLKLLAAFEQAEKSAGQFLQEAAESGWEAAVEKLNAGDETAGTRRLETRSNLARVGAAEAQSLAARAEADPSGRSMLKARRQQALFAERLSELVESGAEASNKLLAFEPQMSCYAVKSVSRGRLTTADYDKARARTVFIEDFSRSQALAAVHFNPDGIERRTAFRWIEAGGGPEDGA